MAVGFRIYNQDNVLQISDALSNLALKYKGTLTPVTGIRFPYEVSIQGDGLVNPVIAIEPGSTTQIVCLTRLTQLDSDSFLWRFATSTTTPFTYYIYDGYSAAIAAADTAGVRIYKNGTSEIAWSTAEYPMRVVGGGTSLSGLPSGKSYAGMQTGIGTSVTSSAAPVESPYAFTVRRYLTGIRRTSATAISMVLYNFSTYQTNTAPGTFASGSPVLVALDVTSQTASAGLVGSGDPADVITAANWANISTTGFAGSSSATISDIGTSIEMSAESSNPDITLVITVNGVTKTNPFTVAPDAVVAFSVDNTVATSETDSIVVRNLSNANAVVDTITVSLGGFYDTIPDAVDWATISVRPAHTGANANQTISGIGGPISISWTDTGAGITVTARKNGGAYQASPLSVNNGDTVNFYAENFTASNNSGVVTVSTGGNVIDTFSTILGPAP
tara:strand:+ start:56468 stop:57805 length:1338 start_codon:yes stop_codon:yes gene_type:complete